MMALVMRDGFEKLMAAEIDRAAGPEVRIALGPIVARSSCTPSP
jgi:hypothetical protein